MSELNSPQARHIQKWEWRAARIGWALAALALVTQGIDSLKQIRLAVLERGGKISIVPQSN